MAQPLGSVDESGETLLKGETQKEAAALDVEKQLTSSPPVKDTTLKRSPPPSGGDNALKALRAGSEFALILAVIYLCDRTTPAARRSGPKYQEPKAFWGVWAVICGLALLFTIRPTSRASKPLSREQTEEWKGWMQIMFLLYHYFAEVELYNAIRVYIAAYVWMTGYGNLLYYQKTGNFGVVRVAQTLFRLNFFVVFICIALRNEFMLYYICPMHTAFTLFVWLALRLFKEGNKSPRILAVKILATLAATYCLYDVASIFRVAFGWQPLRFLLAFHDPLHPEFTDELHEWQFRSGLDRYVWVYGMALAAGLPYLEEALGRVDRLATTHGCLAQAAARGAIAAIALAAGAYWYLNVYALQKFAYNGLHPYTSFVPITVYIVLRNLFPLLRAYYLNLFAFLGKVTLETYILQFHVWMHSTGLNGSPKSLLFILPPDHYWLNFILVSAFYLYLSHRVFHLTVDLKDTLVPTEPALLYRRAAYGLAIALLFYFIGHSCQTLIRKPQDAAYNNNNDNNSQQQQQQQQQH